jgi:hypothetical protein
MGGFCEGKPVPTPIRDSKIPRQKRDEQPLTLDVPCKDESVCVDEYGKQDIMQQCAGGRCVGKSCALHITPNVPCPEDQVCVVKPRPIPYELMGASGVCALRAKRCEEDRECPPGWTCSRYLFKWDEKLCGGKRDSSCKFCAWKGGPNAPKKSM